jgi:hypothetical protein
MESPQAMAWTSPHHIETHRWPLFHETGGLGGDALGDSVGRGTKEAPIGSWSGVAWFGEVGAPPALGEPCTPFGLEDFRESGMVLSAGGLRGLSTFSDSLPVGALFTKGSGLMS